VAVVQVALNTSTGPQTIALPSGFGTVKGYLAFASNDTNNTSTPTNESAWSCGGTDGTDQSLACVLSEHAVPTTNTFRNMETTEVIQLLEPFNSTTATEVIEVDIGTTPFDTDDEFTINVGRNDNSAAVLVNFMVFGGDDDMKCKIGTGNQTADNGVAQTFSGVGFQIDQIFFWTTTGGTGTPGATAGISFGFCSLDSGVIHQGCHADVSQDNAGTSTLVGIHRDDRVLSSLSTAGSISREVECVKMDVSGEFDLTKRAASVNMEFHYLAVSYSGAVNFEVANFDTPTATGNDVQTWPGFTPQAVLLIPSFMTAVNAVQQSDFGGVGAMGVCAFDGTEQWAVGFSDEDNEPETDTQSLADDIAVQFSSDDGSQAFEATFVSFDAGDGYTLNFTAADSTIRKWTGLAIEEDTGAPPTGRIMSSLVGAGGLAGMGGIAGQGGGLAA